MRFKTFKKLIDYHKAFKDNLDKLSDAGINLVESDIFDSYFGTFSEIMEEEYGKEGHEWVDWWIYDKKYGQNKTYNAYNKENELIPTDTVEDVHNLLENIKNGDSSHG